MNTIMTANAEQTMTSREIAELTGKQHFHVIRDIEKMLNAFHNPKLDDDCKGISLNPNLDDDCKGISLNPNLDAVVKSTTYKDSTGRTLKQYELNEEMTMTLITGYSIPLRHAVIKRWQELEQQQNQPQLPTTYIDALESLLEAKKSEARLIEQNKELEDNICEVSMNHSSIDNAVNMQNDEMTISAFATYSGFRMIDIKRTLHSVGLLQSQREFCAYAKAIQDDFFATRDTVYGRQHVFTRKGVAVAEMIMHGMSLGDAKKAWKKGVETHSKQFRTVDASMFIKR